MDWRAIGFDWNRARAFLVVAEEGSLSAAARALGLTQPTIGRQVAALEAELGTVLFARVGHGLEPTEAGLALLDHVRGMGDAAMRLSLSATGNAESIEGIVRISAGELVAAHLLAPAIARLRREAPGVVLEILASNEASDLKRREADIAIRSFRPRQADLVARKLRDAAARLHASPGYLDAIGPLCSAADLRRADFICFDDPGPMIAALNAIGLELGPENFPLRSESHLAQWEMARRGLGIVVGPEEIGDADPDLRRVLPELPAISFPLWLTAHREVRTSRRIRLVFDLLAETLASPQVARRQA